MKLTVDRKWKKESYTIGRLYIDGEFFCNTLEDKDRGLDQNMNIRDIKSKKVQNQTAIPTGTYKITLDVKSPKFSTYEFYDEVCQGHLPRLIGVPGFEGILLHVADGPRGAGLVQGCLGVGYNKIKGGLVDGKEVFKKLYNKLKEANGDITIEIY